jgi:HK97 family phage major capsid protein/HK97 family phage prohead protease
MADELKVGRLLRDMPGGDVIVVRKQGEPLRMTFPVSSETPVDRWFGTEVLRHDDKSVRMDRMNGGAAPLLFNHNWDDPVGMIDRAFIKDKRLWVDAHMFDTERAREVAAMIDGGMRNVSIGYELYTVEEDTKQNRFTATDWGVLEASFATVPADPSVGVGRKQDDTARDVRVVRKTVSQPAATTATPGVANMADANAAAGAVADDQQDQGVQTRAAVQPKQGPSGAEMEAQRKKAIERLSQAGNIPNATRDMWITAGWDWDKVSEDYLQIQTQRAEQTKKQQASAIGLSEAEAKRFSIFNAVNAVINKNWSKAGFEAECSRAIAHKLNRLPDEHKFFVPFEVQQQPVGNKRDLTVASAAGGGYLVGTDNTSFIELMRNRSVVYSMGARRLAGLVGSVTVPKQTAAGTAVWLANEASTATESAQTFGQMALSPKTVGAYTEISRNLLLQSSPDAEGIVKADLAAVCALAIDVGALRGSGSGGEPAGIVGTSGVGSVTGTSLDAAKVLEFQSDVAGGNLLTEAFGYVTTPAVAALLMVRPELPTTGTTRLWAGSLLNGSLFGQRAMSSNQMSSATMLGGDFSQVVIAEWGVLEVEVNPYANFQAGIVGVRAMVTMDVGVRYGGAFSYATSIT